MVRRKNHLRLTRANFLSIFLSVMALSSAFAGKQTIAIPEVNLKPEKNTRQYKAAQTQITHINHEQINQSPVTSFTELLKQEQSIIRVTNNSGDSSQTSLSLRGFGDNAVANSLILVDGFPLTNPSLLAPNFNSITLADIERIDITQGSAGTLWGDQAVGGVVNIITRHPKKFFANATASVGSYSKYYSGVLAGDKFDNGVFIKASGFKNKTNNYRAHNQQSDDNLATQLGMDYTKGLVSLNLQIYSDDVDFPGGLTQDQLNVDPQQATNLINHSHSQTQLIQLLSKHELNDNWLLETRLAHHDTRGDGFVYLTFNRYDSLTSINPRITGTIYRSRVTLGYDGQISRYQLTNKSIHSRTHATQNNIYAQVVIPMNNQFDLTLGGRAARQQNTIEEVISRSTHSLNNVVVTEQGFSYHPTNEWSFFLRKDGNFSFPKANEETWLPNNIHSLKTQTGTSYETGAAWLTEKQRSQLSLYKLQLHNEIAFNPTQTPSQPFGSFNNLDNTIRDGITLTEFYQLTPKLAFDSQLNYVNARFASGPYSGNLIPAVPAVTGNIGLKFSLTEQWRTKFSALYTGTRYASEDVENNGKRIPSYWLDDLTIQYTFKSVDVSFEVVNAFNQHYFAYTYYDPITKSNTYYPGAGRNYLLTVKVNLD